MIEVLASGSNGNCQLGLGHEEDVNVFEKCIFDNPYTIKNVIDIKAGGNHTLAIVEFENGERKLYGSGRNSEHQLGESNEEIFDKFYELSLTKLNLKGWSPSLISACWNTSYVIFENRERDQLLISFGDPEFGCRASQSINDSIINVIEDDELDLHDFIITHLSSSFRHVMLGLQHRYKTFSRILGWGACRKGQLGDQFTKLSYLNKPTTLLESNNEVIIDLVTGRDHSIVHLSNNEFHLWGKNSFGQLSISDINSLKVIKSGWRCCVGYDGHSLKTYGSKWTKTHGSINNASGIIFNSDLSISKISVGSEHTLFLLENNDFFSFGWNEHGNLANGNNENQEIPQKVCLNPYLLILNLFSGNATSWIVVNNSNAGFNEINNNNKHV